jgi:putative endopeptidase
MIRRSGIAFLGLLAFLFPLTLSSQSSDSRAAASGHSTLAGCLSFIAAEASGGGALAADDKSASHGFDLANLDRSVSPCEDFDKFANGGWKKNNPIPADRSSWGSFNKLKNNNDQELRQILEEAAKDKAAQQGSNWQKIGDFYASERDFCLWL